MSSFLCRLLVTAVQGLVLVLVHSAEDEGGTDKKAWACFGNFHNFLDINCPQDRQVKLISMMNGAKPTNQNCSSITTDLDNFRQDCCTFTKGDCVIQTHPNSFPVECSERSFCRPQSRQADTGPKCNDNDFPTFTHYTEITYRCIIPPSTTTTTISSSSSTARTVEDSTQTTVVASKSLSITTTTTATTTTSTLYTAQPVSQDDDGDDLTPAMIGGMIAGIVGLMLTIFIFKFYWGRKRQIRVSGKTQNSVWDFLLSNTMSVRAFRGYDNFSSSSRHSISSEDGSPVTRKTVWLPNISLDSGRGGSNLTSDDNCSVVTVERTAALAAASASVSAASAARELRVGNVRGSIRGAGGARIIRNGGNNQGASGSGNVRGSVRSAGSIRSAGNEGNNPGASGSGSSSVIINKL